MIPRQFHLPEIRGATLIKITVGMLSLFIAQGRANELKIGVLTDLSGVNSDNTGTGMVASVKMAIADFGGKAVGAPVTVLTADHQSRPDIGAAIARRWYEIDGVDAIVDVSQTNIAFPISDLAAKYNRVFSTGAASTSFSDDRCSANTLQWSHDTYTMSFGPSRLLVEDGYKTWFYLAVDYAFGLDLVEKSSATVRAAGGKVLGSVRHPLGASDLSSFLLTAQSSAAQVLAIASAGDDVNEAVKEAQEFGLAASGTKLATLFGVINNVHALGLKVGKGLYVTESFYWDLNDDTSAFARRFFETTGKMPNLTQAAQYSFVTHYLKTIDRFARDDVDKMHDGRWVVERMKSWPTEDPIFGKAYLRKSGRHVHDFYVFQVKAPEESKGAWDYYKLLKSYKGDSAYLPLSQSRCPLDKEP